MSTHRTTAGGRNVDVITDGLGPTGATGATGATAANLLGQRGISTLVVERDDTIYPRQRAIASDEDAHRVWQNLGLAVAGGFGVAGAAADAQLPLTFRV